jgi:RNA polymerase sigma-70 factor, ECF subfamily
VIAIASKMPHLSFTSFWPLPSAASHAPVESPYDRLIVSLFAALGTRFGGDAESLDEETNARLVDQARAGDTGARQRLYLQHVDRVYRTVRGILRSDADAEEATQDAMLKVLTSLHTYTPRTNTRFAAWVTTIAVNTARRRFRRRRPELTKTGELPDLAQDDADPSEALDRARQRRALLIVLAELSERERLIVSLRYGAELDASEIGSATGLTSAAVRKILERARKRLGARLDALLNPQKDQQA